MAEKHDVLGGFHDWNDLYDEDVKKVGPIYRELMQKYDAAGRRPDPKKVHEWRKWVEDELYKIGIRGTLSYNILEGGFSLDLMGRVEGAPEYEHGFDHEKKQFEVLDANEKGEKFRGQKERAK